MASKYVKKGWVNPEYQVLRFDTTRGSGKRWEGPSVEGSSLHEFDGAFHRVTAKKQSQITDTRSASGSSVGYYNVKRFGPS